MLREEIFIARWSKMIYTHAMHMKIRHQFICLILFIPNLHPVYMHVKRWKWNIRERERKRNLPIKRDAYVFFDAVLHTKVMWLLWVSPRLHRKPPLPSPYLHCNLEGKRNFCRGIKSNVNICLLCMKKKSILSRNEKRGSPYIHFIKKWFCIKGADLISLKCADFILLCL